MYYFKIFHTCRSMNSETGSICGLIALYLSLFDTILTSSQLRSMTYESMRETILSELDVPNDEEISDRQLLEWYYTSIIFTNLFESQAI